MYTSSFEAMCQKCTRLSTSSTVLCQEARRLLEAFKALKSGMAPVILIYIAAGVTIIVCLMYRATLLRQDLPGLLGSMMEAGFLLLCIFNICLVCEDSFQSIQGLKAHLGYVLVQAYLLCQSSSRTRNTGKAMPLNVFQPSTCSRLASEKCFGEERKKLENSKFKST